MNSIDASDHYVKEATENPASLLNVVIDTNPHAWAYLTPTLPLSRAVAALLVFLNAHIAFNTSNRISVVASHAQRAQFLYPPSPTPAPAPTSNGAGLHTTDAATDAAMLDVQPSADISSHEPANFYRPFAALAGCLKSSLADLISSTSTATLTLPPTTALAGALTLALTHTHKTSLTMAPPSTAGTGASGAIDSDTIAAGKLAPGLTARILVVSTTPASPSQYIPLMNAIFAAQRLRIPIDVLALNPSLVRAAGPANGVADVAASTEDDASPFLQQAATTTGGIYLPLEHAQGLLQTLMQAFLPSPPARSSLVPPARPGVDFRAACFCHRRVVDIGYVCSVCLSIFCEVPEDATCLTCGTHLKLGRYGRSPVVVARRKKRRRKEETGTSGAATPSGDTPAR